MVIAGVLLILLLFVFCSCRIAGTTDDFNDNKLDK